VKNIVIIFVICFPAFLNAAGFYISVGTGYSISGSSDINVGNIGLRDTSISRSSTVVDKTILADTDGIDTGIDGAVRMVIDTATATHYSSLLKAASYNKAIKNTAYSGSIGWAFKNMRIEAELKNAVLQIQPKSSVYDVIMSRDWESLITSYCVVGHQTGTTASSCAKNGMQVDISECPDLSNLGPTHNPTCHKNETTMSGQTGDTAINDIIVDGNNADFAFKAANINMNNYLGFMNFIYELPVSKSFTLFTGVGFGYGSSSISGAVLPKTKQAFSYPAYQYKMGMYYSMTSHIDITINYANINMIGTVKRTDIIIKDTALQSIDFGLRYNFSKRSPTFFEDYNYKKIAQKYVDIFSLPALDNNGSKRIKKY